MLQKELAYKSGITPSSLCLIENNRMWPSMYTIEQVAKILNTPLSFLLLFSITKDELPKDKYDEAVAAIETLKNILVEQTPNK